uniref:NADH-ubiquinone oxidoreductase chain 2 n=1 Tax=Nomia chalybeata TaxID=2448184 RepID=A0A7L8EYA8_9HYME|nr:NADH dehydrogenase subunit 2 [Nomia chalybeata]QOE17499.1 NADH dehydrogenase subunit 2 [Nomia chalybeata]
MSMSLYMITLMSLYFSNFFILWFFMEISSLMFISMISLMNFKKNSIFYYLISSISSILLLFSYLFIHNKFNLEINNLNKNNNMYETIITFSIFMKLGMFPMHLWTNIMFKNINFMIIFYFSTLMKVIPLLLLYNYLELESLLYLLLFVSILMAPFLMLAQSSIKLMFIYSSMFHTSLMIPMIILSNKIWLMYFCMYMVSSYLLFNYLMKFKITDMMDLKLNIFFNKYMNYKFIFLIMTYCQFPPMMTFFMKFNLINLLMNTNDLLLSVFIIFMSMFSTFNYLNNFNLIHFKNLIKPIYLIKNVKTKMNKMDTLMVSLAFTVYFMPMMY